MNLRLLFWESTTACNLQCVHCRRLDVATELSKRDMCTDQVKKFISTLPEVGKGGGAIFVFSGGEPLKRPDIFELAHHAHSIGLTTALATNATLITEQTAKQIRETNIHRVSVSFDGPDAKTHDHFRGSGSFGAAIAGAKQLRNQNISLQINSTIARHNYHELDRIYDLALSLTADALHLFMLVPVGCGMELPESTMLHPTEYEKALHWIYGRSLENKLQMKATCAPHYFRVMRQRGTPSPIGTKGCLAGQAVAFVSHTGEVFPCGYLPVSSGNVTVTPFPQIWRESKVFATLRDDSNLHGKCGLCEFKKICMGCRARAYAKTNNYLAEEPNCDFVPTRMRSK